MDKSTLIKKLLAKNVKDYTYATLFFFIFSFFVAFIIRPNLISVFGAKEKIEQLKKINALYDNQIEKIIEVQSILETNRDNLEYLDQAIAPNPKVNKVLSDLYNTASQNKLTPDKIDVSDVNLKDQGSAEKVKSLSVDLNAKGIFEDTIAFIKEIYQQRRLKLIQQLSVGRNEKETSTSSQLKIQLKIEGYYL